MRGSLAAALAFKGRALANCRAEPCLIVHLPGSKTRSITSRTATGVCGQLHDCRCKDQASPLTQSSSSVGSPSRFSSLPAGLAICPRAAAQRVTKRRKTLVQVEPQLPGRASIARSSLNCQVGPQLPGRASIARSGLNCQVGPQLPDRASTARSSLNCQVEPQLPGRASIARSSLNCQVGPQLDVRPKCKTAGFAHRESGRL